MSEINRWSTSAGGALQNASGYFPEGQAPSTVNDAARTIMAELRRHQQATSGLKTATYATQAYSVTFDREVTAGERAGIWSFIADEANHSGSATLNINALGAKDLRKPSGHLETSDINAKQICVVAYNATGDYYELLSRTTKELNIVNQPNVTELTASDSFGIYIKATGRHSQISVENSLFTPRLSAEVATTSGTTANITGIPSWTKRVTLMFDGVSSNGTGHLRMQIGDSGGLETTGYIGDAMQITSSATTNGNSTANFPLSVDNSAGRSYYGALTLELEDLANNVWTLRGQLTSGTNGLFMSTGRKSLSAVLTQITLTFGGTDTFDAGAVSAMYE